MADTSGPIFHPEGAVHAMLDGIEHSVAKHIESVWLTNLNASIQVNRGRYVSNVNTRQVADGYIVNDNGIVYGPWLEGTSSRNESTRFKGYAALRRALGEVDSLIPGISEKHVALFVAEMNA